MSFVELSDEETVAILAETFVDSLSDLGDRTRQIAVLKRIHQLLESSTPQHYIYETVHGRDELEVIRVGDDLRIFCRLVMGLPDRDERYNVIFLFYVDDHAYRVHQLTAFDAAAEQRLRAVTALEAVEDVERYLTEMNAFSAAQFRERIRRMET